MHLSIGVLEEKLGARAQKFARLSLNFPTKEKKFSYAFAFRLNFPS
jgi:hypothetical protein